MKTFLLKLFIFFIILTALFVLGLMLPATPHSRTSALFSKIEKDKILQETPSPRLIFIGGSNLSLGLNSQMIKDELHVNPINTSIMVNIGLDYLIHDSLKYIKPGDVVIISPEYLYFYDHAFYGREPLLWTVLDVAPNTIKDLSWSQWQNIYKFLPSYAFSKFNPHEYFSDTIESVYLRYNYNKYGDNLRLESAPRKFFIPFSKDNWPQRFDYFVLDELLRYQDQLTAKGATLYFTFPCLQDKSFDNNILVIKKVESELRQSGFNILGTPERYKMADSLMFDSPYHLIKKGADYRTKLLIEDLRPYINSSNIK